MLIDSHHIDILARLGVNLGSCQLVEIADARNETEDAQSVLRDIDENRSGKRELPGNKLEKPDSRYKCASCSRAFLRNGNLQKHIIQKHKKKINHCKVCDRSFASKIKLKRHQSLKHTKSDTQETNRSEEGRSKCESCDKYFSTKGNLKLHIVNKRCSYQAENVSTLKDNKKRNDRRNLSQAESERNVNEDLISEEMNDDSIRIEFDDSDDDENETETNNEKLIKYDENVNKAGIFPVIEFDDSDSD